MGTQKERLKTAIRDELLARMASGPDKESGQLSADWLYGDYLPSLSSKEVEALEEALAEMVADGVIVTVQGRRPTYRLANKGRTT